MSRANKVRVFNVLAEGLRGRVLVLGESDGRTTAELCSSYPVLDRCTVVYHLLLLERDGVLMVRREGRWRWNHLHPRPIKEIYDRWISPYASGAVKLLARLKRDVEE